VVPDVLAPSGRRLLAQFARSNVLAAFDYDGTLAPIAETPDGALMRPRTRELLRRLSCNFPTVVISGRAQADVRRHLAGTAVLEVIGNHGIEPWSCRAGYHRQARRWLERLRVALAGLRGVWIEDKRFSVAVHYRQAADVEGTRRAVERALSRLGPVRVVSGKRVYNLLPRTAPDKGAALERARAWLGCEAALYVGDDDTDEDVFRLETRTPLLSVRVGSRRSSAAMFRLRGQQMIDELLDTLLRLRLSAERKHRRCH
jgi:trehalose 6-phosphate phosphatase